MKYTIMKMDGRFSHHDKFAYCIKFSGSMSQSQGPLQFNDAVKWFVDTYGWSAEIRQYDKMMKWVTTDRQFSSQTWYGGPLQTMLTESPECCNSHWSWTNGYEDLRIYVRSSAELNFFQLKWPNDFQ